MCTRRRQEFCGSAALWPSTRPKPTVSGETTCSPSSHVGPHRLTWTFARVLCQGSGAKKAAASINSFWGPVPTQKGGNKAFRRRAASAGTQTATNSSLPRPSCLPTQDNEMLAGGVLQTMALFSPMRKRREQRALAAASVRRQSQSQQKTVFVESAQIRQGLFESSTQIWCARKKSTLGLAREAASGAQLKPSCNPPGT